MNNNKGACINIHCCFCSILRLLTDGHACGDRGLGGCRNGCVTTKVGELPPRTDHAGRSECGMCESGVPPRRSLGHEHECNVKHVSIQTEVNSVDSLAASLRGQVKTSSGIGLQDKVKHSSNQTEVNSFDSYVVPVGGQVKTSGAIGLEDNSSNVYQSSPPGSLGVPAEINVHSAQNSTLLNSSFDMALKDLQFSSSNVQASNALTQNSIHANNYDANACLSVCTQGAGLDTDRRRGAPEGGERGPTDVTEGNMQPDVRKQGPEWAFSRTPWAKVSRATAAPPSDPSPCSPRPPHGDKSPGAKPATAYSKTANETECAHYGQKVLFNINDVGMIAHMCDRHGLSGDGKLSCDTCLLEIHDRVVLSGQHNFAECKIPIPSNFHIPFWEEQLVDYWDREVVEFIKYGFPVSFKGPVPPVRTVKNHKGATDFPQFMDKYIDKEVALSATMGPFEVSPLALPLFISPLNTVPKATPTERRTILDLSMPKGRSINDSIQKGHYLEEQYELQYPSLDSFLDLVRASGRGCCMFKRDLSRAYRQIPVCPLDWSLLGFSWREKLYFDRVLAMGIRSGALIMQRISTSLMYVYSRQATVPGVAYLDDLGSCARPEEAQKAFDTLGTVIGDSGLIEAGEKAVSPTTIMTFLGIEVDSNSMEIRVPQDKLDDIFSILDRWASKKSATKRQLQSLIGKLQFLAKCVAAGRVFISRLLVTLRSLKLPHHRFKVRGEFTKDLAWWNRFLLQFNNRSIISDKLWSAPDGQFSSDSCLTGGGAECGDEFMHFVYPPHLRDKHISQLELLVVVIAVKRWGQGWKGKRIRIWCDSEVACSVINTGRTRDPFLLKCIRELAYLSATGQFQIKACHIPGVENRVSDWLSRWHLSHKYADRFWTEMGSRQVREVQLPGDSFTFINDW